LHVPLLVDFPGARLERQVPDVATLTNFPTLVESVLAGDPDPEAFVSDDGVVLASTDGIDPDTQERAREYLDNISTRTAGVDAVYTGSGTDVEKAVRWDDRSATIAVRDAHNAWVTATDDGGTVEAAFADVADAGVATDSDGDVGHSVKQRLEDLGYA
jgi:hypothetical protein